MNNIPFQSKLIDIIDLDAKNKAFSGLTKEEKRREIAYDGLKLIMFNMLAGNPGGYWNQTLHDMRDKAKNSKDLCRRLNKLPKAKCYVCARGAVMLSQIRLGNNINPTDRDVNSGRVGIVDGFSMFDMEKMESVYECWTRTKHPYECSSTKLLANIMCNVIANGNFLIKDKTDYLKLWELSISEPSVTYHELQKL